MTHIYRRHDSLSYLSYRPTRPAPVRVGYMKHVCVCAASIYMTCVFIELIESESCLLYMKHMCVCATSIYMTCVFIELIENESCLLYMKHVCVCAASI